MHKDIDVILEDWEFDPKGLLVRKIRGLDGKEKIQMRVELGVIQMDLEGKPDGTRPYGSESLLDYYLSLLKEHEKRDTGEDFKLDNDDCVKLQMELMQYYQRRISFLELEEYQKAIGDAEHNLQIMDLIKEYAQEEQYKIEVDRWRPFVTMQMTRADALISLDRKDHQEALDKIQEGIGQIEDFYKEYEREDLIEMSIELRALTSWYDEVEASKPLTKEQKLEKELEEALEREDFERAVQLRDELKEIRDK